MIFGLIFLYVVKMTLKKLVQKLKIPFQYFLQNSPLLILFIDLFVNRFCFLTTGVKKRTERKTNEWRSPIFLSSFFFEYITFLINNCESYHRSNGLLFSSVYAVLCKNSVFFRTKSSHDAMYFHLKCSWRNWLFMKKISNELFASYV